MRTGAAYDEEEEKEEERSEVIAIAVQAEHARSWQMDTSPDSTAPDAPMFR